MKSHPAFNVRGYDKKDFSQVAKLWEQTGISTPGRGDTAALIENTLKHGGRLLVLEEKMSGNLVGTSWLTNDGRRLYLHHFAVAPAFQGRGLSKPLLRKSLQIAREAGRQIKLEVHRDNIHAVSLYKNAGFQRLGDYDVYIIRDLSEIKELE
jgi:ribosomal protein S18 acetylase RimI-like enzyme